jgi:hypothetical protein
VITLNVPRYLVVLVGLAMIAGGTLVAVFAPSIHAIGGRLYSRVPILARILREPVMIASTRVSAAVMVLAGIALLAIGALARYS